MKWTIGSLTQLEHLTPNERKKILKPIGLIQNYAYMVVSSLLASLLIAVIIASMLYENMPDTWLHISSCVFLFTFPLCYQYQLRRVQKGIVNSQKKIGETERLPVCIHCGYDLTAISQTHCPECGARVTPD